MAAHLDTMSIIRSARDVRKDDKIIAIMGPTGSGKSNLIDRLTRKTEWSGDSLKSVTQKVRAIRITLPSTGEIVLVDTPGFDDTTRSDLEILRIISDWLNETYRKGGVKLTGILYLHRISDNRMSGSPHRNLRMLGKLCGSKPARRLVFVTTMWDRVDGRGEERERDLKDRYFKPMLELGADTARFNNTSDSALQIITRVLKRREEEEATLIQEEMVDSKRDLIETEAAKEVRSDLQKLLTSHKQTIEALKREAEKADNQEMVALLNKERADIQKQLEKTYSEAQELKIPLSRRIKLFFGSKPKSRVVSLGS